MMAKILKWKWVKRLRGELWVVRKGLFPYPDGYITYLPHTKTVLDTGLTKGHAERACLKMNDPELYELRYGGNGMGPCILQGIRARADQDLWEVGRFVGLLVVVAILGILAAVVVPNVSKFVGSGSTEAANTELSNVQAAVDAAIHFALALAE